MATEVIFAAVTNFRITGSVSIFTRQIRVSRSRLKIILPHDKNIIPGLNINITIDASIDLLPVTQRDSTSRFRNVICPP